MSAVETFDPSSVTPLLVTAKAKQRLHGINKDEKPYFRVYITGGGCSGFQYGFQFEDSLGDDDSEIDIGKIKVIIDALSLQYLEGSELCFQEDLMGARFLVKNDKATTCSCGMSFSI